MLSCASLLLMSLIYAPISWWPLSFVCLVPWIMLVGSASRAPRAYFYSYFMALAFFLINMRWLYPATGWGYLMLSVYQAAYFPLVACPVRSVVRRRHWPLALVLPFVWVGSEMLRSVVISGFPWFFLSHSLYRVLTLVQVSDLTGAYGVSFAVAAVNGAVADFLRGRLASRTTPLTSRGFAGHRFSLMYAAGLLCAIIIYGQVQLARDTTTPGPKIAVLQGDFISLVDGDAVSDADKRNIYFSMIEAASRQEPDLYLLPETPWFMYLNPESRNFFKSSRESYQALQGFAASQNAYVVTGSASLEVNSSDLLAKERRYNSATVVHPDGREPDRYDKNHLVPFGEAVPFRFGRLRFAYFWLNRMMPFSGRDGTDEYSLFRGNGFHVFNMRPKSQPGHTYRFGVPICYEDVMPYVSREFVSGGHQEKRADLLLNISNDGWFGRGVQQPQHLAICVFRAVENRVGIARAVNTGISGFIEPNGRPHDLVTGEEPSPWPGKTGYSVAHVGVDSRYTLYSRYGDWFGWGCALVWLALFVDYWVVRVRIAYLPTS